MDSLYLVRKPNIVQETKDQAQYQIEGIVPGKYTVTAIEHPSWAGCTITRQQSKTLVLKDSEQAVLDFDLSDIFVDQQISTSSEGEIEFVESEKLKEFDIGRSAVQIEMRILHTSENFPKEVGEKLNLKLDPNTPLDDLQIDTLLKAAQADEGTKMLATPQVTVFDNEPAQFSMHSEIPYVSGYTEPNNPAEKPKPIIDYKKIGTFCELTPHVTPDKRNVFLNFELENSQLTGFEERIFQGKYKEQVPRIETKTIATSKTIPAGKTLFLDGGTITIYEKKEATSAETSSERTKEKKRLIILIKPTVLSPEQTEQLGLDRTRPPAMMGGYGGYGQGELPPGFGGMGGSGYGTPPPEILKIQSAGSR